jgi:hypothetical protein
MTIYSCVQDDTVACDEMDTINKCTVTQLFTFLKNCHKKLRVAYELRFSRQDYTLFYCHLIYTIEIGSSVPFLLLHSLFPKQEAVLGIIQIGHLTQVLNQFSRNFVILPLYNPNIHSNLKLFHSFVFN